MSLLIIECKPHKDRDRCSNHKVYPGPGIMLVLSTHQMNKCTSVGMSTFHFPVKSFFFFFRFLTSFLSLHTLECLRITWGAILKCKFPGPTFSRTEVGTEDFLTSTSENSNASGQCILKTLSYSLLILKPGAI